MVVDDICNAQGRNAGVEQRGVDFRARVFDEVPPPGFVLNKKHLHFFEQMRKGIMPDVVQQTRREQHAHVLDVDSWRVRRFEQLFEEVPGNVKHAQGVFKTRMPCAGIHEQNMPELRYVAQALKFFGIDEADKIGRDVNIAPYRVPNGLAFFEESEVEHGWFGLFGRSESAEWVTMFIPTGILAV